MDIALTDAKAIEGLTEHDLRAKAASDAGTLDWASPLLSQADSHTASTFYRLKPEPVQLLQDIV